MNRQSIKPARRGAQMATAAIGGLTAITVLATTVLAVVAAAADDPVPREATPEPTVSVPTGPETVFPDGQLVYGTQQTNIVFEVPAEYEGWEREPSGTTYFMEDAEGNATVKVHNPAAFNKGVCAATGRPISQAWVGVTLTGTKDGDSLEFIQDDMFRAWLRATRRTDQGRLPILREPRTIEVTTKSGLPALRTMVTIGGEGGGCDAAKGQLLVQTVEIADRWTSVVMNRDLGAAGTLSGKTAGQIMDTIDAEVPPE